MAKPIALSQLLLTCAGMGARCYCCVQAGAGGASRPSAIMWLCMLASGTSMAAARGTHQMPTAGHALSPCLLPAPPVPDPLPPWALQFVATYYRGVAGYKNKSAKALVAAWDEGKRYPDMGCPQDTQADNMCKVGRWSGRRHAAALLP
jgi:hypothetical protein